MQNPFSILIFLIISFQCELREGEKSYTSRISSPEHLSLFWEGLEESTKRIISRDLKINPSNVNTTNNNYYIQKTRWQVYAEKFFAHLLHKDEIDPLQGAHLKELANLKTQVANSDPGMYYTYRKQIYPYYSNILSLKPNFVSFCYFLIGFHEKTFLDLLDYPLNREQKEFNYNK